MLHYEQEAWAQGVVLLAGVDEAGRGPLAGPVVAAALVFEKDYLRREAARALSGLTDSKKLPPKRREFFLDLLQREAAVQFAVGVLDPADIDRLNILRATHRAMAQALARLPALPELALVDGLPVPGLPCASRSIIKGDALSLSIAAASIVAKVTRDHLMDELDRQYPEYGFARHKGYGTRAHLEALRRHGPCPIHRRSFRPVGQGVLAFE